MDRWFDADEYDDERLFRVYSRGESVASSTSSVSLPQLIPSASTFDSIALLTPQDSHQDLEAPEYSEDAQDEAWIAEVWRSHRFSVKEGKQPQRPICYDSLIAYLPGDTAEEWAGIDFAIDLSRREHEDHDPSGVFSGGEHSKSRESWAVMHQDWVHPYYQNDEYGRWVMWHRYLDEQEEARKIERLETFDMYSFLYLKERRLREWIVGQNDDLPDVVRRELEVISAYRPDPYFPRVKHDFAWVLKRTRSVASLRDFVRPLLS